MDVVRRARPWLGTMVDVRVEGLPRDGALAAIDAAFAEIAAIHRLMSFHEADSDLSRLNRNGDTTSVDARTYEVMSIAMNIARVSQGAFDPTIAVRQVEHGKLPRPSSRDADNAGTWRDIELLDEHRIRLQRPLWIDLGGIAKGYAVDRAIEILIEAGASQACVNAGGDLRVHGDRQESVDVKTSRGATPLLELSNASLATSTTAEHSHLDGVTRQPICAMRTASIVASTCVVADALTKVVLAGATNVVESTLAMFGARACVHDEHDGWRILERAA
jgi:thiamine biosynthesis lipoprotein